MRPRVGSIDKGHCQDCNGPLIEFYPVGDVRVTKTPHYCAECKVLWFGEDKVELPDRMRELTPSVSDSIKEASQKAAEDLQNDPHSRVQHYFENVFKWAFTEGFVRAYAYFRHKFKEGRLKRIRELWAAGNVDYYKGTFGGLKLSEFKELDKLIKWNESEQKLQKT